MLKATLKSLLAHKVRLLLTAIAIVIGVGFMAGTFVLTDTIKTGLSSQFSSTQAGKTVVVRGVSAFSSSGIGGGQENLGGNTRPLVPQSLLATVRAVPGVAVADGSVQGTVNLSRNGKALSGSHMAPTIGLAWEQDRVLSALEVSSGRGPQRAGEVVIDKKTATTNAVHVGDVITVTGNAGPQPYKVVGIVTFGSQDTLAGATIAAFDTATAQQVVGHPGFFTTIDVGGTAGANADKLATAIGATLPPHYEAINAATAAAQMAAAFNSFINGFNRVLLAFGFIALFVGAFVIFNTFTILIGQRTRELALLRAVGAGQGQVIGSVLGEAVILGLFGAAAGLAFGIGLAFLLTHALKSVLSLGTTTLQILPRTIVISLVAGVVVTLVSALLPAYRASRIPPVAAMREDVPVTESSLRRQVITGAVILAGGVALLVLGLMGSKSISLVGAGALLIFVAVAILIPLITSPLAMLIGAPLQALGITGHLGRENAARNPRRTASTASALMIGVAVVAAIATLAASALASFTGIFDREFQASYVVSSSSLEFPAAPAEAALRKAPGVTALSGFQQLPWHLKQAGKTVDGIDGTQGPEVLKIAMVDGSVSSLAEGKLLVDQTTATNDRLHVGDTVTMTFDVTGDKKVTIGGIYQDNSLLSEHYVLSTAILAGNTNTLRDAFVLVRTAETTPAAQKALENAMSGFPNLKIQTGAQFKADQEKGLKGFLTIVYVLLGLSIVIALFGIVNTLALSVLERTREIGLLRAVGMMRRQSRSMILSESVVVAVLGAVLGLVLGIAIGAAMVNTVVGGGPGTTVLAIPVSTIIVVLVVAALFGLLAGLFPAHRASRLDVLKAISTV